MIEFGGNFYSIDLDAIDKVINITVDKNNKTIKETNTKTYLDESGKIISVEVNESTVERFAEVNPAKYDLIKTMIDVIMDGDEEIEDSLGVDLGLSKSSLSFKIAFNTLFSYGIIKSV